MWEAEADEDARWVYVGRGEGPKVAISLPTHLTEHDCRRIAAELEGKLRLLDRVSARLEVEHLEVTQS